MNVACLSFFARDPQQQAFLIVPEGNSWNLQEFDT